LIFHLVYANLGQFFGGLVFRTRVISDDVPYNSIGEDEQAIIERAMRFFCTQHYIFYPCEFFHDTASLRTISEMQFIEEYRCNLHYPDLKKQKHFPSGIKIIVAKISYGFIDRVINSIHAPGKVSGYHILFWPLNAHNAPSITDWRLSFTIHELESAIKIGLQDFMTKRLLEKMEDALEVEHLILESAYEPSPSTA